MDAKFTPEMDSLCVVTRKPWITDELIDKHIPGLCGDYLSEIWDAYRKKLVKQDPSTPELLSGWFAKLPGVRETILQHFLPELEMAICEEESLCSGCGEVTKHLEEGRCSLCRYEDAYDRYQHSGSFRDLYNV
jgi:hypothetical protein